MSTILSSYAGRPTVLRYCGSTEEKVERSSSSRVKFEVRGKNKYGEEVTLDLNFEDAEAVAEGLVKGINTLPDKMDLTAESARLLLVDWAGDGYSVEPKVYPGSHEGLSDQFRLIIWEEGPADWTLDFPQSVEATTFTHSAVIWFEARNNYCLVIGPNVEDGS